MKAKSKPLEVITIDSVGVNYAPTQTVLEVFAPPKRQAGVKVDSVSELVDKLRNDAKVID
jgi:electron transfer flavoprotein beta subunit